jgi:hypothetical protein
MRRLRRVEEAFVRTGWTVEHIDATMSAEDVRTTATRLLRL